MWQRSKPYLLIAPATGAMLLLFVGGLWEGVLQSLGYRPLVGQSRLTLQFYETLLSSADFWRSLGLTLRVSILSTLAGGVLGLMISVCLVMLAGAGPFKHSRFWRHVFQLPLLIPHFVAAYLAVVMMIQTGWIPRLMFALGFLDQPADFPVLVQDRFGWGIVLTYAWKEAPFIAWMLYPVLYRTQEKWWEVARVFGSGRWAYFREILLPLLLPAWMTASFIVFAFTFSAFEVPYLLGVTYPQMLPVWSFEMYTGGDLTKRPAALAVNVLLAGMAVFFGWLAHRTGRRFGLLEGGRWE
ncbi:putative spermidine/putrescine transport system permease protein [Melghirimyces profundicolus]|uniref:Putative spermidine/putrescine transport system permease protein n=1 Tax=Melghirimyces profundicolus TaxID=1242148 RepID=A0A2T6C8T2_9BACL|nr:sugar ABC transporter permease [Melghirimyces profundicolus]PTX64722.1 putative spermidine/putrescine transport system permease protein [Melghirimyces profundicolus]